jgi:hypothetical protein
MSYQALGCTDAKVTAGMFHALLENTTKPIVTGPIESVLNFTHPSVEQNFVIGDPAQERMPEPLVRNRSKLELTGYPALCIAVLCIKCFDLTKL